MTTNSTGGADKAEPFDQTNAIAGNLEGESDGTEEGDLRSRAERQDETGTGGDDNGPGGRNRVGFQS